MYDPKVHVGVGVAIMRFPGEVLLLKRAPDATHGGSTWALPGGWIDYGETVEEAAVRELKEELGIYISTDEVSQEFVVANEYPDEDMHVLCALVFASWDSDSEQQPENREPDKHSEMRWVRVQDIPCLELFPPLETAALRWGWK